MIYDTNNINTGDCFGFSGESKQAKLIQKFQRLADKDSAYINHTGVFIWICGILYICEAIEWKDKKLRALVLLTPYTDYLYKKKGEMFHFKYVGKRVRNKVMSKYIIDTLGTPYEYRNLVFHQVIRTVTDKLFDKGWWIGDTTAERVICHENTQNIWNNYNGLFPKFYEGDITRLYYNENFRLMQMM